MITYGRVENVTHEWTPVEIYELPGTEIPVLLAAMQTFEGTNTADVRIRSLRQLDFGVFTLPDGYVKIEEEQSANVEIRHTEETVGYIGFEPGRIKDTDGNDIGYAGLLEAEQLSGDVDDPWRPLPVPHSFSNDDIVAFMQVLTFNGSQPVHSRIANPHPTTGDSGFYFKLEEWPTYDQRHVRERLGYVVLREGRHAPGLGEDPHLEVGTTDPLNHIEGEDPWQTLELGNLFGSGPPAVITQCQTFNGHDPVVTRQRESDDNQIEVRLQEAESQGEHPYEEVVGYLAMGVPLY